ncbi:hypothetical protein [Actinoplanes palleronii]|uniref:Uncharacterized protein n=1 Tax=Actinoplanes palleronii TaxID=113570 RepID=A0ABQ4BCB2_9ACTN|nr:hypothetical protein [Actinoplanes palleronii]GIE68326.1 hypothetical protein Apa02nite_044340 [Actinoplanes palleronii]
MRTQNWAARWLVALTGVLVAGLLLLGRAPFRYCGTLAVAVLLAYAIGQTTWTRPQQWAISGLALLTLDASLVDADSGGRGWPADILGGDGPLAPLRDWLLTAGGFALAVALLFSATRAARWLLAGAAVLAVVATGSTWFMTTISRPAEVRALSSDLYYSDPAERAYVIFSTQTPGDLSAQIPGDLYTRTTSAVAAQTTSTFSAQTAGDELVVELSATSTADQPALRGWPSWDPFRGPAWTRAWEPPWDPSTLEVDTERQTAAFTAALLLLALAALVTVLFPPAHGTALHSPRSDR